MEKEQILKIFYKYGFHSLNKEPFLYEGKLGKGICYICKDPIYGNLTRIYIPKTTEEAENFLAQYYWFKKNGEKAKVKMQLSDYKKENPKVTFVLDNKVLTLEDMNQLSREYPKNKTLKETAYLKKIKRTALLLVEIIEDKIKVQNTTYQNALRLNEKYNALKNTLETKKKQYTNQQDEIDKRDKIDESILEYEQELMEMKERIQVSTQEQLEAFIETLTAFIKNLELNESFIQNKYQLICLPLKIDIVEKQLEIIESALKVKKGIFNKKENITAALEKVAQESSLKDIVSFKVYKQNELKRVEEKYSMLPELDIRTIGDFLVEFDNLKVTEPLIKDFSDTITAYSYENIMKELENNFFKRPKEEQQILILYHSILKTIRFYLECGQKEKSKNHIEEFIELIENQSNIMFKIKYFKNIDTSSVDHCIETLTKEFAKLEEIASEKILGDINVFFKDGKKVSSKRYLEASNKKLLAPNQKLEDNEVTYIATLKEGTNVYFVPVELTYDFESEDLIIQKNNQPFFLIDMKKNKIISDDFAILKVVKYKEIKSKTPLGTVVTELRNEKVEQYQKIIIGGNIHEQKNV